MLAKLTIESSGSVTKRSRSLAVSDHSKVMVSAGPHGDSAKPQRNGIRVTKVSFLVSCTLYVARTMQLNPDNFVEITSGGNQGSPGPFAKLLAKVAILM